MKVIDAFWEKRNLEVDTIEVSIEVNDSKEEVREALSQIKAEYIVIKVPSTRADLMFLLNSMGYTFIEGSIHLTHNLKRMELLGIQKRLVDQVSYEEMNGEDIQQLYSEIRKGIFTTDRIYLDQHFTKEQAYNRYINWINDEIVKGTEVYKLQYKGEAFGFFTFKDIGNDVFYPFLAGVYMDYRNTGLGIAFNYKPLCEAVNRKGKLISTYISTNNINAIRMHSIMGYQFDEVSYVCIKHLKY